MRRYRTAGLFVGLAAVWGVSFMAIKAGLASLPPLFFAAIRYDIAGVLLLGYAIYATEHWAPKSKSDWTVVAVGAVLVIALYNALLFVGEQGVTSAVAAIIIAMNPILATGFARVLLPSERLTPTGMVGLLLGFSGVGLVAQPSPAALVGRELFAPGLILLAAASVALGSVLIQRTDSAISTVGLVAWSNAFGAILLHLFSVAAPSESLATVTFSARAIVAVLYLAIFASAAGYVIYFELLDRIGAIEINLVSYAAPIFAALSGWLVLGEVVEPMTVAGFLLICGGFVLVKRHAIRGELVARQNRR